MDIKKYTPLIKIKYKYKGKEKIIYAKLEYYNLTGSIKDRMASYIITKAKERGELNANTPIIEATSGNTGIALASIGAKEKNKVYIFMPDWVSKERKEIMKSYGAIVKCYSQEEGGFKRCIEEANKLSKEINGFLVNQFSNKDNILAHYETTAKEIIDQIDEKIGGFVSGIGTGGTLMGISRRLKKQYKNIIVAAMEPDKMPLLSQNKIGLPHKIDGIGDDFVPELVDRNLIDKIIDINDDDAVNMSRLLARKLGLGVGISSGANFIASTILNDSIIEPTVTIFVDDNKKYLSTELVQNVDLNPRFISNQIELLEWEYVNNKT